MIPRKGGLNHRMKTGRHMTCSENEMIFALKNKQTKYKSCIGKEPAEFADVCPDPSRVCVLSFSQTKFSK
jgi:hypothetical protein